MVDALWWRGDGGSGAPAQPVVTKLVIPTQVETPPSIPVTV